MRTVTFSEGKVRKALRRDFRMAWRNLEGEKSAGASFAHEPDDPAGSCLRGVGEHNVQILFTTPKGELLHAVAGFVSAEDLLAEAALAADLSEKLAKIESETARRRMVEYAQRKAAAADRKAEAEEDDLFADLRRHRLVKDHEFCRLRALMDARDFRPTDMVGNAQTFFGSSGGQRPGERIGEMPRNGSRADDFDRMLREIEEQQRRDKRGGK